MPLSGHSNPAPAPLTPTSPAATLPAAHQPAVPAATQAGTAVGVLLRPGESAHQLTLRLDPVELGHLQIAITRPKDAPPSVALTVERPETLLLLLRDQPALHRALDQAGVPADGRSISFHLAAPSHDAGAHADTGGFQGAPQNGGWQQGHQTSSNPQGQQQSPVPARPGASQPATRPTVFMALPARQTWQRAGVDITA
jgi:flagellar hook-length control protein FliK